MADVVVFRAPWGTTLMAVTAATCVILVAVMLLGLITGPRDQPFWMITMIGLPLVILIACGLFMVRGYTLSNSTLYVQRLLWSTPIALDHLQSAEIVPEAMNHSLRTWGNGGLFSFTGHFRNAKLGPYEAFVTDFKRTVVLTFPDRKIVLSPQQPEKFVASILLPPADV
jgi:hypothetical protein